jgi:isopenicillin-N N-acyltransferase-like protein
MTFPVIDLAGRPFDMGLAHGSTLADSIKANYRTYIKMIDGTAGLSQKKIIETVRGFIPELENATPHLLEEMHGIAKGAGVPLETILVLNCRTELLYPDYLGSECTAIGLTGDRTTDGRVLLAQNWDWIPAVNTTSAFFRIQPDNSPRALILAEAGQVGKLGFNEEGLGLLLNLLVGRGVRFGIPVHVLLRQIMSAANVAEAEDMVKKSRPASSSHMLLGDISGRVVGLEVSPGGVATIKPQQGVVAHTNHFCDSELAAHNLGLEIVPDTTTRLSRANHLLDSQRKWDSKGIKKILTDHMNQPTSICRHVKPEDPEDVQMKTLASVIFELPERSVWVAHGQPCQTDYYKVSL